LTFYLGDVVDIREGLRHLLDALPGYRLPQQRSITQHSNNTGCN
jgi:hypothetical protein